MNSTNSFLKIVAIAAFAYSVQTAAQENSQIAFYSTPTKKFDSAAFPNFFGEKTTSPNDALSKAWVTGRATQAGLNVARLALEMGADPNAIRYGVGGEGDAAASMLNLTITKVPIQASFYFGRTPQELDDLRIYRGWISLLLEFRADPHVVTRTSTYRSDEGDAKFWSMKTFTCPPDVKDLILRYYEASDGTSAAEISNGFAGKAQPIVNGKKIPLLTDFQSDQLGIQLLENLERGESEAELYPEIERLVLSGANVNYSINPYAPVPNILFWALEKKFSKIARIIILAGGDLKFRNYLGQTALMVSSKNNLSEIETLIMESL